MFRLLCPLAFLLLFLSLISLWVRGCSGRTFPFFLFFLLFLLFLILTHVTMFGIIPPVTAEWASSLLLDGWFGVVSGIRPFLDSVCSLFQGVSFVGVSLGVATFPRVPNATGTISGTFSSVPWGVSSHDWLSWHCWNCTIRAAIKPLMWTPLPLGMWGSSAGGSGGGGGPKSLDKWASFLSWMHGIISHCSTFSLHGHDAV